MSPALNSTKTEKFLGYARIQLRHLNFAHDHFRYQHRAIDAVKVQRIYNIFRLKGCNRSKEEYCISAILDPNQVATTVLDKLHQSREIGQARSLSIGQVDCLHGAYRIKAAKRLLNRNDQWWPCRLFATGISVNAVQRIVETYRNEQPYSDGEIFFKILQRRKQGEPTKEKKWWARLSPAKRKDLKQLLRNPSFANTFSDLTRFPGLFTRINLGTHRISGLKCDEDTWTAIVTTEFGTTGQCVDAVTVKHLELLAPGLFNGDALQAQQAIDNCFSSVSPSERKALLANVLTQRRLIPSLRTLFENLKFIEPCCQIMKRLLGENQRRSIQAGFWASFFVPPESTIETAEATYALYSPSLEQEQRRLGYIMLWLNCLRNLPRLVNATPRKVPGKAKPSVQQENPALWQRLAGLAVRQGFLTEPAVKLNEHDPDLALAEVFLASAAPTFETQHAKEIAAVLKSVRRPERTAAEPQFSSETALPPERRCGRPFEDDHTTDKEWLFLPSLLNVVTSRKYSGKHPTRLFIKYSTMSSFFDFENSTIGIGLPQNRPLAQPELMIGIENASYTCCTCVDRYRLQSENSKKLAEDSEYKLNKIKLEVIEWKRSFEEIHESEKNKFNEMADLNRKKQDEMKQFYEWQRQKDLPQLQGSRPDPDKLFDSDDDMDEDSHQLALEVKDQKITEAEGMINRLNLDLEQANTARNALQKRLDTTRDDLQKQLDDAIRERNGFLKGLPRLLMFRKGQYFDVVEQQCLSVLRSTEDKGIGQYRKLILLEDFPDVGIVSQMLVFPYDTYCHNALDDFFHSVQLQNEDQPDSDSRKFVFPLVRARDALLKSTQKAAKLFNDHEVVFIGSSGSIRKLQQNLWKRGVGPEEPERTNKEGGLFNSIHASPKRARKQFRVTRKEGVHVFSPDLPGMSSGNGES